MAKRSLPKFSLLLGSYPDQQKPCDQSWDNQCAIRVSLALSGAGFQLLGYSDPLCKHGHARGAESLANYLWKQAGAPKIYKDAAKAKAATNEKTGIVLFRNITGFRGGLGDHIDLWNKTATITGEYFDDCIETWFWEAR